MSGPVAGPIASSAAGQNPRTEPTSGATSAAKDSAPARLLRVSAARLEEIERKLSEQDWAVLNFLSASRLATGKQLVSGLYFADRKDAPGRARVARRHLKRLSDWRLIDALPGRAIGGLHGGSDTLVYGVGVTGARLLARRGLRQKRLGTPGRLYTNHTLACTQVAVELRLADARGELDLIEIQQEPQCWRSFLGGLGTPVTLKPDMYVRVALPASAHEYRAMVEVDRATEAATTIRAKAERYLSHYRSGAEIRAQGVHPRIVWTVPDSRRAGQLAGVLDRLPADTRKLFAVCQAEQFVSLLVAEARS